MRREELYMSDIVEAAEHIADFIAGLDSSSFHRIFGEELPSGLVLAG